MNRGAGKPIRHAPREGITQVVRARSVEMGRSATAPGNAFRYAPLIFGIQRCAAALTRQVPADFRAGRLSALRRRNGWGLPAADFYADYLKTCAAHQQSTWTPGVSGGDHAPAWPAPVEARLRKRLRSQPPATYSFAASEVLRRCHFDLDRAPVPVEAVHLEFAHHRPRGAPTAESPSALSRYASKLRPALASCSATIHRVTTPCWQFHRTQKPNRSSCSPTFPNDRVRF